MAHFRTLSSRTEHGGLTRGIIAAVVVGLTPVSVLALETHAELATVWGK